MTYDPVIAALDEAEATVSTTKEAAPKVNSTHGFYAYEKPIKHPFTNEIVGHDTFLKIEDEALINYLRNVTHERLFYGSAIDIEQAAFFPMIRSLERSRNGAPKSYKHFLKHIQDAFAEQRAEYDRLMADGRITFDWLWFFFEQGMKVTGELRGQPIAGEIMKTGYMRTFFGSLFKVTIKVVKTNGLKVSIGQQQIMVPSVSGPVKIEDLPVRPLDADTEAKLVERGRIFASVATGCHYMNYTGTLARRSWRSSQVFRADGRVMIDQPSMQTIDPSYFEDSPYEEREGNQQPGGANITTVPEDMLYATYPFVLGFSFRLKKWGELCVSGISPITFRSDAFDRLVIDPERKTLILSLVQQTGSASFSDVIEGKGGGCIFLLHGEPGVGKTLTAEATAELLKRPLYMVSVGELGVEPKELEENLRKILDMASTWNAVVLIDEADIFLEARTERDIVRNAMVGVFLRLLEYHQGVLFLTTNRVRNFDEAFHSRISVALKYGHLTEAARTSIWRNLLDAAGITTMDPAELAHYDLNGRQIKNTVRLAQSLAKNEGVEPSAEHVRRTIGIAQQFATDLKD